MPAPWQVPKTCEQEGVEAKMALDQAREQYDRTDDYQSSYGALPDDIYRKVGYLHEEGQMGRSTFHAGSVFGAPAKSQDIADTAEAVKPVKE